MADSIEDEIFLDYEALLEGQNANDKSAKSDCSEYEVLDELNEPNDDSIFYWPLNSMRGNAGEPDAYGSENDDILLLASQQQANDETCQHYCDEYELSFEYDDEILLLGSQQYELKEINDETCPQYNCELSYECDGDDGFFVLHIAHQQYEECSKHHSVEQDKYKMLVYEPEAEASTSMVAKQFASPLTEGDILKLIDGSIPANTNKTTLWAVNTWKEWERARYLAL